ncbi:hypothetical protein G3580_01515 [Nitrogeniibacter mangrovi]|uniref:Uncharacterized protein n=1 Tax=Nitrogeniibacter mangrovi TaxID=2016596 RepID=A0A6C1B096_9RHOO|nr:hypothetical protein [Nitrogeniibacter mangrovi]QID16419.1 hypothetical protein G3580_01515 [Nitrogeniibacter mangrovi]
MNAPDAKVARSRWRWRWPVAAVALLLPGVLLVTLMSMPGWLDAWLVGRIGAQLQGRLEMHLDPELMSALPGVNARQLRWRAVGSPPGTIDITHLSARTPWRVDGAVRPIEVVVSGARIELHQGADGRWPLPLPVGPAGDGAPPVTLGSVRADDVALRLVPVSGPPVEAHIAHLTIDPTDAGWQVRMEGAVAAERVRWVGRMQTRAQWKDGAIAVREAVVRGTLSWPGGGLDTLTLAAESGWRRDGAVQIDGLDIDARGRVDAVPDASIALHGRLPQLALADGRFSARLAPLRAQIAGAWPARIELAEATVVLADGQLSLQPLALTVRHEDATRPLEAITTGGALTLDLPQGEAHVAQTGLSLRVPDPARPSARITVHGHVSGAATRDPLQASGALALTLTPSRLVAQWSVDGARARPLHLHGTVNRFDLDRWLRPDPADRAPPSLAAWRDLPLTLDLTVDELVWHGVTVRSAHLTLDGDTAPR